MKWYRKTVDLLLATLVINALYLYKIVTNNSMTIVEFEENIIKKKYYHTGMSATLA